MFVINGHLTYNMQKLHVLIANLIPTCDNQSAICILGGHTSCLKKDLGKVLTKVFRMILREDP